MQEKTIISQIIRVTSEEDQSTSSATSSIVVALPLPLAALRSALDSSWSTSLSQLLSVFDDEGVLGCGPGTSPSAELDPHCGIGSDFSPSRGLPCTAECVPMPASCDTVLDAGELVWSCAVDSNPIVASGEWTMDELEGTGTIPMSEPSLGL